MKKEILSTILLVVCTALIVFCFTRLVISLTNIIGDSMYPTYKQNDLVLVNRLNKQINRFDVVIAKKDGTPYIKRVIGLPGETIFAIDGKVYVNNAPLDDIVNEYTEWLDESPITLGENEYFLLGDNRTVSKDSRMVGSFTIKEITGKVMCIIPKWIIVIVLAGIGLAFGISYANDKKKKQNIIEEKQNNE